MSYSKTNKIGTSSNTLLINYGFQDSNLVNWTKITFLAHSNTNYAVIGTVHAKSTAASSAPLSVRLGDSEKPKKVSSCYIGVKSGTASYPGQWMTIGGF